MREQANRRVVLGAMDEVFMAANLAAVDELYAPDFVNHVPPSLGADVRGQEHVKQFVAHWRRALPDLVHQVEDVRTDRDMVVVRWRARGTHEGRLWGVGPTGASSRFRPSSCRESWTAASSSSGWPWTPSAWPSSSGSRHR